MAVRAARAAGGRSFCSSRKAQPAGVCTFFPGLPFSFCAELASYLLARPVFPRSAAHLYHAAHTLAADVCSPACTLCLIEGPRCGSLLYYDSDSILADIHVSMRLSHTVLLSSLPVIVPPNSPVLAHCSHAACSAPEMSHCTCNNRIGRL